MLLGKPMVDADAVGRAAVFQPSTEPTEVLLHRDFGVKAGDRGVGEARAAILGAAQAQGDILFKHIEAAHVGAFQHRQRPDEYIGITSPSA